MTGQAYRGLRCPLDGLVLREDRTIGPLNGRIACGDGHEWGVEKTTHGGRVTRVVLTSLTSADVLADPAATSIRRRS